MTPTTTIAMPATVHVGMLALRSGGSSLATARFTNVSLTLKRSTLTLVRHFKKAIQEDGSPEVMSRMTTLVMNAKAPPAIRVELALFLKAADAFPADVANRLLGPGIPTMLRVIAAGTILGHQSDPRAVQILREAVKMPNREIALAAAAVVQKYLAVDLGLPVGSEMPAANSREAAEVTRRVLQWASAKSADQAAETPPDATIVRKDKAFF